MGSQILTEDGLINTPLQRGACGRACKLNRFSGFSRAFAGPRAEKPLKRFNQSQQRTITPLKRGVNETRTAPMKNSVVRLVLVAGLSCFCLFACSAFSPAQANPVKCPKRAINQYIVDLQPLFHWWTNRAGERPLEAWVHITGRIVGTNSWGWVLHAHVEDAGRTNNGVAEEGNIILKNPPHADRAEFEALKARMKVLLAERDAGAAQVADAHRHLKAVTDQQKGSRQHHTIRLAREGANWKETEKAAQEQLKPIDKEIADINTKLSAFPDRQKYAVDCFALRPSEKINGLPVYDHGAVLR